MGWHSHIFDLVPFEITGGRLRYRMPGQAAGGEGSGLKVRGLGFRVQGARFKVQGAGFRVQGSRFKV